MKLTTTENTHSFHSYNTLYWSTPKFCISIVFRFSWELKWPQEKLKTFWNDQLRVLWYVMVFSVVVNSIRFWPWKFGLYGIIMTAPILDYDIANMIWLPMCLVHTHHLDSYSCTLNNFQSSYKWRELTMNWRLQKVVVDSKNWVANRWCSTVILLHERCLQFDWLRAVVFQLNLKYPHVKITNLLRVVV